MPSERVQRQIDRFLDEAAAATERLDWALVRDRVQAVLTMDPENLDARAYLDIAERGLASSPTSTPMPEAPPQPATPSPLIGARLIAPAQPTVFAGGRYQVKKFLGEGGKKKVYLAHDTLLDRDVAFAVIKTEGLDDAGRQRVQREAQAMGGEVTPRSDLYSLGAMLYEMVTGRPPFVGDDTVAIIGQHLNIPPVSPAWHRPDCPPALEALILRLLEKDPSRRPASASEVGEALGSVNLSPNLSP